MIGNLLFNVLIWITAGAAGAAGAAAVVFFRELPRPLRSASAAALARAARAAALIGRVGVGGGRHLAEFGGRIAVAPPKTFGFIKMIWCVFYIIWKQTKDTCNEDMMGWVRTGPCSSAMQT